MTNATQTPKPATAGTSTDQKDTVRSLTAGMSNSIEPPRMKHTMPPTKSRPNDVTKTSATISDMPTRISSSPTHEKGRIWKAMAASTRQTAPTIPGASMPGCWNST